MKSSKNSELKPRITLRNEKGEIIKKADGNEARYYLVLIQFYQLKTTKISAGDVLARLPKETSRLKILQEDYHEWQNYLKQEDLKDSAIIAENDGVIEFAKRLEVNKKYQ